MYDNGLLKHYKTNAFKDGFINTKQLGFIKNLDIVGSKITQCSIDGKSYYIKSHSHKGVICKSPADAEILLSQIYTKFGLQSSIYLPAECQGEKFLLCDDVENQNVVLAANYLSQVCNSTGKRLRPFLSTEPGGANPKNFYTRNAMSQQTKMRILDVASYNTDRHFANFFYKTEELPERQISLGSHIVELFRMIKTGKISEKVPNKVEDIITIDFESSGGNMSVMENGGMAINSYMNDFTRTVMSRQALIDEITSNEQVAELVDKTEIAESIGSLNPHGVAQDIKETIGYEVEPKMLDILAKSYDDMAETLIQ